MLQNDITDLPDLADFCLRAFLLYIDDLRYAFLRKYMMITTDTFLEAKLSHKTRYEVRFSCRNRVDHKIARRLQIVSTGQGVVEMCLGSIPLWATRAA